MEDYREILLYTISIITKTYFVYMLSIVIALILCFIFKNKAKVRKIRNGLLAVLVCVLIAYSVLFIPRYIDLKNDSYIKVEEAALSIDETNTIKNSGSIMFYGYADVFLKDGGSIKVFGINFFEFPTSDPYEKYYGDIVYAKHSRQIIAVETSK